MDPFFSPLTVYLVGSGIKLVRDYFSRGHEGHGEGHGKHGGGLMANVLDGWENDGAMGALGGVCASGFETLAHIGPHALYEAWVHKLKKGPALADYLHNQHLDKLTGRVLAAAVQHAAKTSPHPDTKADLAVLVKIIPGLWERYTATQPQPIGAFTAQDATRLIAETLAKEPPAPTFQSTALQPFLDWIPSQKEGQKLKESPVLQYIAKDLAQDLPAKLAHALSSDLPAAGPAWKTVILRLQSDALQSLAAMRKEMVEGFDKLSQQHDQQLHYLADLTQFQREIADTLTQWTAYFQQRPGLASAELDALRECIEDVDDNIRGLRADIRQVLKANAEMKEQVDALVLAQQYNFTRLWQTLDSFKAEIIDTVVQQHRLTREVILGYLRNAKLGLESQPQGRHTWDYQLLCYAESIPTRYGKPRILQDDSLHVPGDAFDITDVFVQPLTSWVRMEPKAKGRVFTENFDLEILQAAKATTFAASISFYGYRSLPALAPFRHPDVRLHVLLGDPGFGKSSLLHILVHRWLQCLGGHLRRPRPGKAAPPVPIIIEIRHYLSKCKNHHDLPFLDYLTGDYGHSYNFERQALESALAEGRAWLLFDGLDEAFHLDVRRDLAANIQSLARRYEQARFIVTSRRIGFEADSWHSAHWMIRLIADFDQPRMERLVRRFDQIQRFNPQFHDEILPIVLDSIARHTHTQDLGKNPLLLTLLCLVASSGGLPEDRLTLYKSAVKYFIIKLEQWKSPRDADEEMRRLREQARGQGSVYTDHNKIELLCHAAWEMQGDSKRWDSNFIPTADISHCLLQTLIQLRWSDPVRGCEEELRLMQERNYLLTERGDGTMMFIHRTFLEYFAALHELPKLQGLYQLEPEDKKQRLDTLFQDLIAKRWRKDTWLVMIEFLFGLVDQDTAIELGERFLAQKDKQRPWTLPLFAARLCLARGRGKGADPGDPTDIATGLCLRSRLWDLLESLGKKDGTSSNAEDEAAEQITAMLCRLWPQDQPLQDQLVAFFSDEAKPWDIRRRVIRATVAHHGPQEWLRRALMALATRPDCRSSVRNEAFRQLDQRWGDADFNQAIQGLAGLEKLEVLNLYGCTGLRSTQGLGQLRSLKTLYLQDCTGLEGEEALAGLAGLDKLEVLYLTGCTGLRSTQGLGRLQSLKTLDLQNCTGLEGEGALAGLAGLDKLKELWLHGCTGLKGVDVGAVIKKLGLKCDVFEP